MTLLIRMSKAMKVRRLGTRFFLASCLLVATTVACGIWSVFTFGRLSRVVGESLRESQRTIDLAARLASALEREDDALLLAIAGDRDRASIELAAERRYFDEGYPRLLELLVDTDERAAAESAPLLGGRYGG
jgi:NtrC-family two-component system sensor histidine kinase KinB